jgi:hypothetical protein
MDDRKKAWSSINHSILSGYMYSILSKMVIVKWSPTAVRPSEYMYDVSLCSQI